MRPGGDLLLISFDSGGVAGVLSFDDEDVLAYDSLASTHTKNFEGSTSDPTNWPSTDLVALPEPGTAIQIGLGTAALAALARSREISARRGSRSAAARP